MMTLDQLNRRLAPLARRLIRVRSRAGVMRYALAPDFGLVWPTYGAALADLSELRWVREPPPYTLGVWPTLTASASVGTWLPGAGGHPDAWLPASRNIGVPPHFLRDAGCETGDTP